MTKEEQIKELYKILFEQHHNGKFYPTCDSCKRDAKAILGVGYTKIPELTLISDEDRDDYCLNHARKCTMNCMKCGTKAQLAFENKTLGRE